MAGGGDAAGRGLESTDTAKMSGYANGAATVTANAAHRAACGDGGGFATTGAAWRVRDIPRVAGFSGEKIVGFVGHEKFGRVGVAEKNGSGGFQARDERSVCARNVVFTEKRACGAWPVGDVDAAFDGKRNAVQRAEELVLRDGAFRSAGLGASGVSVQMDKSVELGLKGFDAAQVRVDKFDGGNLFGADACSDFGNGGEGRNVGHNRKCESIRA